MLPPLSMIMRVILTIIMLFRATDPGSLIPAAGRTNLFLVVVGKAALYSFLPSLHIRISRFKG